MAGLFKGITLKGFGAAPAMIGKTHLTLSEAEYPRKQYRKPYGFQDKPDGV